MDIALVLSSGSARGLAHIGVIEELEAQGQADGGGRTSRPEEENRTFGIEERLESDVCEKLRSVQMDMMTPLESLNLMYELKKMLS